MKQTLLHLRLIALATFSMFLFSCEKNEDPKASIVDVVVSSPDFSILKAAVLKADMATELSQPNLTVFAPDNDAFGASGITESTINSLDKNTVGLIVRNHVIVPSTYSGSIKNGTTEALAFNGQPIFINKVNTGITINGVKVKAADANARNGVIHTVEKVIMPAPGSVVQIAINSPVHKRLVQAVVKCGLVSALSNSSSRFTVFAPTDAAFAAIGFDSTVIANTPASALTPILLYHVIGKTVLSYDLTEGLEAATLKPTPGNTNLIFSLAGGAKVRGGGNPANVFANITGANLFATNGVVHVIDRVLLP